MIPKTNNFRHSKIFKLLKTLDAEELRELGEALHSPLFNRNREVVCLFDALAGHLLASDDFLRPAKRRPQAVPPGKSLEKQYLRDLLLKSVRDYLAFREMKIAPFERELLLHRALRRKKQAEDSDSVWLEAFRQLERDRATALDAEQLRLRFLAEKYRDLVFKNDLDSAFAAVLDQYPDALFRAWLSDRLLQSLGNRPPREPGPEDFLFPAGILETVGAGLEKMPPAIQLLYYANQIRRQPGKISLEYAHLALTLWESGRADLSVLEGLTLFRFLYSYFVNHWKSTKQREDLGLVVRVFRQLPPRIAAATGLTPRQYISGARTFMKLGAFEAAAGFLEAYKFALEADQREVIYHYGCLLLYAHQGDTRALDIDRDQLQQAKLRDRSLEVLLRILIIQSLYDSRHIDLDSLLARSLALEKYIKKHTGELEKDAAGFRSCSRYLTQLIRSRLIPGRNNIRAFRNAVAAAKNLPEQEWLLAKIDATGGS